MWGAALGRSALHGAAESLASASSAAPLKLGSLIFPQGENSERTGTLFSGVPVRAKALANQIKYTTLHVVTPRTLVEQSAPAFRASLRGVFSMSK